jgi:hypothetical protein
LLSFAISSALGDAQVALRQQGLVVESLRCHPKKITLFFARTPDPVGQKKRIRSKYLN